jgi:hypothetical protein
MSLVERKTDLTVEELRALMEECGYPVDQSEKPGLTAVIPEGNDGEPRHDEVVWARVKANTRD